MREVSRSLLSPLLADIRFLVCEHASPRPGGYPRQTGLHSRNPQMRQAHNLSNRYKILENNLRPHRQTPKGEAVGDTLEGTLDVFQSPTKSPKDTPEAGEMEVMNRGGSKSILRPKPRTFGGVLVPVMPQPPASDECCMSSCTVCVYDLYATALEEYEEALTHARSELSTRSIPSSEWPVEVLTESDRRKRREDQGEREASEGGVDAGRRIGITGESERERQMAVVIGAFVKFEQALKEKRKREKAQLQSINRQHSTDSSSQPSLP